MASVYPAMKGKMGSTEYYLLTMKATDVFQSFIVPSEVDGWGNLDIEERYQRQINYKRVRDSMVPYLANDLDRFFGAFIVEIQQADGMHFESANSMIGRSVPVLYKTAAKDFGFLTLTGSEQLIPLDGQHRLAALKFAITGKDEKQNNIGGISPNASIGDDDIVVMMIKHDGKKGRKIFNKVNRYAKPTTKSDNLITADDDIVAVISRSAIADELIPSRIINLSSNTLPKSSYQFTTLAAINDITRYFLERGEGASISDGILPPKNDIDRYKIESQEFWREMLASVQLYKDVQNDDESRDDARKDLRENYVLGKPAGQVALGYAVSNMKYGQTSAGSRLSWVEIYKRVNYVNWRVNNPLWQNVLLRGANPMAGKGDKVFAGRFLAYMMGIKDTNTRQMRDTYKARFATNEQRGVSLPKPLNFNQSDPSEYVA